MHFYFFPSFPLSIKTSFVLREEKSRGERKLLNLRSVSSCSLWSPSLCFNDAKFIISLFSFTYFSVSAVRQAWNLISAHEYSAELQMKSHHCQTKETKTQAAAVLWVQLHLKWEMTQKVRGKTEWSYSSVRRKRGFLFEKHENWWQREKPWQTDRSMWRDSIRQTGRDR